MNLLVVQVAPVQPAAHVQVNELIPSVQVPPFWHGLGAQSSISRKKCIYQSKDVVLNPSKPTVEKSLKSVTLV